MTDPLLLIALTCATAAIAALCLWWREFSLRVEGWRRDEAELHRANELFDMYLRSLNKRGEVLTEATHQRERANALEAEVARLSEANVRLLFGRVA